RGRGNPTPSTRELVLPCRTRTVHATSSAPTYEFACRAVATRRSGRDAQNGGPPTPPVPRPASHSEPNSYTRTHLVWCTLRVRHRGTSWRRRCGRAGPEGVGGRDRARPPPDAPAWWSPAAGGCGRRLRRAAGGCGRRLRRAGAAGSRGGGQARSDRVHGIATAGRPSISRPTRTPEPASYGARYEFGTGVRVRAFVGGRRRRMARTRHCRSAVVQPANSYFPTQLVPCTLRVRHRGTSSRPERGGRVHATPTAAPPGHRRPGASRVLSRCTAARRRAAGSCGRRSPRRAWAPPC